MSNIQLEKNHMFLEETKGLYKTIESGFLELGRRLKKIRDEVLYTPEYDDFQGFLNEAKINKSTASKLITVYTKFIFEWEVQPHKVIEAGWSNSYDILTFAKSRSEAEEWLDKKDSLMPTHFREELRAHKRGIDVNSCKHEKTYVIRVCEDCGKRVREYEE